MNEPLDILLQGPPAAWNEWRTQHTDVSLDFAGATLVGQNLNGTDLRGADLRMARMQAAELGEADLRMANLEGADLSMAHLAWANLRAANLCGANLSDATLKGADLRRSLLVGSLLIRADLYQADLRNSDMRGAYLSSANLSGCKIRRALLVNADLVDANVQSADLRRANLRGANLSSALLVYADLREADLTGCRVHGVSAWNVALEGTIQSNLIITAEGEPDIQLDNLEVAQFVYLLLNNERIRSIIDSITAKVVLILGRFTPERKAILDALREELRKHNYMPVVFDFDKPLSRDLTETISTLAHISRFVIADITDAKSIPQELMIIVPNLPSVPVQPLLLASQREYGMFDHFRRFPWVLQPVLYDDQVNLLAELNGKVIAPAEAKVKELKQWI